MTINERREELKKKSNQNIKSDKGILNYQIRSVQTEGYFGDIKETENFRLFYYCSAEKVYKKFKLYAIDRNINKYRRLSARRNQKRREKEQEDSLDRAVE